MKKRILYQILAAGVLLSLVPSCEKQQEGRNRLFAPEEIALDAAPGATKGMLNAGGLTVDGTQFQMYDYLSGYSGTIDGHTNGEEYQYFSNTLTYKSSEENWKWVFGNVASPTSYHWTRTGTHHFYGWLLKDATGGASDLVSNTFFSTYTVGTKTLTVGKTLTINDPQYDFLYSDVVPVDVLADGIPTTVPMPMKHLFGALGMTISNTSKVDVIVYSVRLLNFPNNGTATLTYDMASGVTLPENDPIKSNTVYWPNKFNSAVTLYKKGDPNGGKVYDCFTGAEMGENLNYRIAWPVTHSALLPTPNGTDDDGNPIYTSDSPLLEVDCKVGTATRSIVKMRFPVVEDAVDAILAGKKTQLNLTFADKQITLSFVTLPWDYEEFPMAFEGDAISTTQLKFIEGSYTPVSEKLVDANGRHEVIQLKESSNPSYVARGRFSIYTPVNARLTVGLSGDTEAFVVTLESGRIYTGTGNESITIDPHRDNGEITLGIKPKGTPQRGKKVFLHFAVTNNGRDTDADSEINRDAFVVVIP